MKYKIFTAIIFFVSITISAQVPKKILMEYATGSNCGPCATYNPGNYDFLKTNYKNTVAVWYHAWWPFFADDPMYLANIDENTARINYYGINGVPDYVLNGIESGWESMELNMTEEFILDHESFMNLTSPLDMNVSAKIIGDSIEISVIIQVLGEVTSPDLVLHTAITEQMVVFTTPPGLNNEVDFPNVFRKFCAGSTGETISALNLGDSLKYTYTEAIDSSWNLDVLTMVAWVQSYSTKEVLQATSDLLFQEIVSNIQAVEVSSDNETSITPLEIENVLDTELQLRIKSELLENNANISYNLQFPGGSQFDSTDITLTPGEKFNFELKIETGSDYGEFNIQIISQNINENSYFKFRKNYYGVVISGDILIIDDDGELDYETNYSRFLNSMSFNFSILSTETLSKIRYFHDFSISKYIFWNLGSQMPTLSDQDVSLLQEYLGKGGNLFIAGQDLGYDIHEVSESSTAKFFYKIFFDAIYLSNHDSSSSIESVPGNPLFDNISFELNDIYSVSPDAVESKKGNSIPVLKFSDSDNAAMLIHIKNDSKIAYLTFGLEQISSENIQDSILNSVMNWFDTPTGISDNKFGTIPTKYALEQNYPNPFNPSTSITFQLVEKGNVELKIYDLLGREIESLVNEYKLPGRYSIEFNANELNSGVYFYSIKVNEFVETKKMMLIK